MGSACVWQLKFAADVMMNAWTFEFQIILLVCRVPHHRVSNHTLALLGPWIMHPCRDQGRFLCKEEAGECMSTKCLQLSWLFIHLFFIESWNPTCEPTNVLLFKRGRRNWLHWCRGTFKGELSDRLSSNYHCSKRAFIHRHELWGGGEFFSFISPTSFSLDCF